MLAWPSVRAHARVLIFTLVLTLGIFSAPAWAETPSGHAAIAHANPDLQSATGAMPLWSAGQRATLGAFDSAFVALPGGGGVELTYGRIAEARDPAASAAQRRGEIRFAGLSAHAHAFGPWSVSLEAEIGQAELARTGWHDVSASFDTSAFAARLTRPMDGARLAPLLGPGLATMTLSVEQPLRLTQQGRSVFGLAYIGGDLRAFDPAASGRELRLSARYDHVADEGDVAAFGEASVIAAPYHIAGAETDARVRFGFSARY